MAVKKTFGLLELELVKLDKFGDLQDVIIVGLNLNGLGVDNNVPLRGIKGLEASQDFCHRKGGGYAIE